MSKNIIISESELISLIKIAINEDSNTAPYAKRKEFDERFPEILEYYLETGCSVKELSQKFGLPEHAINQRITKYFKGLLSNKKIDETLTLTDKVGNKKFKISNNVKDILVSIFKGLNKDSENNITIWTNDDDDIIMVLTNDNKLLVNKKVERYLAKETNLELSQIKYFIMLYVTKIFGESINVEDIVFSEI
jgi:transposase-like protein